MERRGLRRHIQVVFQDPRESLNPRMRIKPIIAKLFSVTGGYNKAETPWRRRNCSIAVRILAQRRKTCSVLREDGHAIDTAIDQGDGIFRASTFCLLSYR